MEEVASLNARCSAGGESLNLGAVRRRWNILGFLCTPRIPQYRERRDYLDEETLRSAGSGPMRALGSMKKLKAGSRRSTKN